MCNVSGGRIEADFSALSAVHLFVSDVIHKVQFKRIHRCHSLDCELLTPVLFYWSAQAKVIVLCVLSALVVVETVAVVESRARNPSADRGE